TDPGWDGETALDLDMVSAGCPDCKILLVQADSSDGSNLGIAVNTAASLGAHAISQSFGGSEDGTEPQQDGMYFDHPGVLITASSGDSGFAGGAQYPATSVKVLAVGGTSLTTAAGARGWSERAWRGAGSGCSGSEAKPSWQTDVGCTRRVEAD